MVHGLWFMVCGSGSGFKREADNLDGVIEGPRAFLGGGQFLMSEVPLYGYLDGAVEGDDGLVVLVAPPAPPPPTYTHTHTHTCTHIHTYTHTDTHTYTHTYTHTHTNTHTHTHTHTKT